MSRNLGSTNHKQKTKDDIFEMACRVPGLLVSAAISLFMAAVIVVMPFYNEAGYTHIGTDKYTFLKNAGIFGVKVLAVLLAFWLAAQLAAEIKAGKKNAAALSGTFRLELSITDLCALMFGFTVLLSFFSSSYQDEAVYGAVGWYMGMATQLGFVLLYFLISHVWRKWKWLPMLFLPVSAAVFVLGYLNRFGVYPFKMESARPDFISTIGNINWYCGYLVTVFFGGVYLLWKADFTKKWVKGLLMAYVAVGFASLVTQGSSSGILTMGVILLLMFFWSVQDADRMCAYLETVFILSAVCIVTCVVRLLAPGAITYSETSMNLFTLSPLPFLMAAVSGGLWYWLRKAAGKKYPEKFFHRLSKIVLIAVLVCAGGFVLILILNTAIPGGIGPLSGVSFLTFGPGWGSNRGATWRAGVMCFMEQDVWHKLVGAGPDCMASFLYTEGSEKLISMVNGQFGGLRLTNAHNEWLSMLVNVGLFGMLSYVGMMVTAIVRFLKKGGSSLIAGACGLCLLAYTVNNMVSFQQSMSAAAMFVVLGVGEAYARREDHQV